MRFGVREICDVVFKAKADMRIGTTQFKKGQPVLYIDSAKTSTIEGAATSVYATGGKGNTRLITWEGEKTLTFTVEDALLSPIGFSILSGAGLFKKAGEQVHVHNTVAAYMGTDGKIDLADALGKDVVDETAPIFVMETADDGSLTGALLDGFAIADEGKSLQGAAVDNGKNVFVDFYVVKDAAKVDELQIDAANFGGYYYVEASTLFRRQIDGVDLPAEITLPNVKIQSNFTFSMASTGDPSTFTFTMDAMPGYTLFDATKKVLCVMQVIDPDEKVYEDHSVMLHKDDEEILLGKDEAGEDADNDSVVIGE